MKDKSFVAKGRAKNVLIGFSIALLSFCSTIMSFSMMTFRALIYLKFNWVILESFGAQRLFCNKSNEGKTMEHLSFAVHLLALATCWASILVSLFLYVKLKKPLIKQFGLFIGSLFLILTALAIMEYEKLTGSSFAALSVGLNATGSTLLVIVTPFFFHELFGIPWRKRENIIFGAVDALLLFSAIGFLLNQQNRVLLIILQALLFGTLSYGVIRGILSVKNMGNRKFRSYLRQLMIVSVLFMPLIMGDSFMGELPFLPHNLALPLFLLIASLQALGFSLLTFDTAPYLKRGSLTSDFISEFGLTEREGDVVSALLKGQTNKEIGTECFISVKTVETHLSSIYQKCEVKNRAQLVNLIQTNASL